MNHQRAPLYESMIDYLRRLTGNFHVPGHKQGQAFDQEAKDFFRPLLQLDFTEVSDLDDLHDATGAIAEAQTLAADAFGAENSLFLVGGTTAGNLATFLSICRPHDQVIIQRSSHQSIFHGCMLAGVRPIYMGAEIDPRTGFEQPIDPKQIVTLLELNPKVKGVWITSPSYFGINQKVKEIASICQQYQIPLIVDEAHGAHYRFYDQLPLSAMACGADIAVQSTHKMLTSMTMSSMIHIQGSRVSVESIKQWLRVIESSSPSYPLMASLDLARRYMMTEGSQQLGKVWRSLSELRQTISRLKHIKELILQPKQDPFKMTLVAKYMTGFEFSSILNQHGLYPELVDEEKVLFVFSVGTTPNECSNLALTLESIDQALSNIKRKRECIRPFPVDSSTTEAMAPLDKIAKAEKVKVPLKKSVGRLSAQLIIPYPPGIPTVLPGERFTLDMVERIDQFIEQGGRVRGVGNDPRKSVLVLQ